jgi:hypothetical protein
LKGAATEFASPRTINKTKAPIVPAVTIHPMKGPVVLTAIVAIAPMVVLSVLLFQVLPLRIQN